MKRNICKNILAAGDAFLLVSAASAGDRSAKEQPIDRIDVVADIAVPGNAISGIQTGSHWRYSYAYLQDAAHQTLTLVDVTDAAHPAITKVL